MSAMARDFRERCGRTAKLRATRSPRLVVGRMQALGFRAQQLPTLLLQLRKNIKCPAAQPYTNPVRSLRWLIARDLTRAHSFPVRWPTCRPSPTWLRNPSALATRTSAPGIRWLWQASAYPRTFTPTTRLERCICCAIGSGPIALGLRAALVVRPYAVGCVRLTNTRHLPGRTTIPLSCIYSQPVRRGAPVVIVDESRR